MNREFNISQHVIAASRLIEQCDTCKFYSEIFEELTNEVRSLRRIRREQSRTIRLLKGALISAMEDEHEAISQADGFAD